MKITTATVKLEVRWKSLAAVTKVGRYSEPVPGPGGASIAVGVSASLPRTPSPQDPKESTTPFAYVSPKAVQMRYRDALATRATAGSIASATAAFPVSDK